MRRIQRLFCFLSFVGACASASAGVLESIAAQVPQAGEDPAPWYASEGAGEQAKELAAWLQPARVYFGERFGVDIPCAVAVLNKDDWTAISKIPYGLPIVSGPPYVLCLPADNDNMLGNLVREALSGSGAEDARTVSEAEIRRFVSLIAFHELGHVYGRQIAGPLPAKWIEELMATYLALCYFEAQQPAEARFWQDSAEKLRTSLRPEQTRLKVFEEQYVGVGVSNYCWYQVVFLERAVELHDRLGDAFATIPRRIEWQAAGDPLHLGSLEAAAPGFQSWAKRHRLAE